MKKTIVVVVLFSLLSGCHIFDNQRKNTPEYVAKTFLEHFQKLEFEEAAEYGTENTRMLLTFFKSLSAMVPEDQKKQNTESDVVIEKCVRDGDKARCDYSANGKNQSIDLIRQEGKWLVDLKKETMNQGK